MKTINIFLASSSEMFHDRNAFGNLVRRLDNIYEKRKMRIKLYEWEDDDNAISFRRKQDFYNEKVRRSDIFIAMFYIKAGQFTIEEFNTALDCFNKNKSVPKIYVYCRNLDPQKGEEPSIELQEFQSRLVNELEQFWSKYDNFESMQFQFVMQLWLLDDGVDIAVSKDSEIEVDGEAVAKMDKMSFVANNETYSYLKNELDDLEKEKKRAQERVEKYPDDESLKTDLKKAIDKLEKVRQKINKYRKNILEIAMQIARLRQSGISEQLKEAIGYFETGQLKVAKAFLEKITRDFDDHVAECESQKKLLANTQETINQEIKAFSLEVKILLTEPSIPIEERITQANDIYIKAVDGAQRSALDDKIQADLLLDYARFLNKYDMSDKALEVLERQLELSEKAYSAQSLMTANTYDEMGLSYEIQKDNLQAEEFYTRAWNIRKKLCDKLHKDYAASMNNLGRIYNNLGDDEGSPSIYAKALKFSTQALRIRIETLGAKAPETARSYSNVGEACLRLNKHARAIKNYKEALAIFQNASNSKEHKEEIASVCNNLGRALYATGHTDEALKYLNKAMKIMMTELGPKHHKTAKVLYNLGDVYMKRKDYARAADCYDKAFDYFGNAEGINEFTIGLSLKKEKAQTELLKARAKKKK